MRLSFVSLIGLTFLAACGGSSTGPTTVDFGSDALGSAPIVPVTPGVPVFASAQATAEALIALSDQFGPLGLTDPADFQRTGTGFFEGALVLNDSGAIEQASVAGGITMAVDFANPENVTALAGNFYDLSENRVDGTLSMRGVEFSEGTIGGGFVGNLTGTLRDVGASGAGATFDYDVEMASIYYGVGVEGIVVIASGSATEAGATVAREISGAATLERD